MLKRVPAGCRRCVSDLSIFCKFTAKERVIIYLNKETNKKLWIVMKWFEAP